MFQFAVFDPRPIAAAAEANDKIFAGAPQGVLGIEVTVQSLASRCVLGNIDPQHSGGDASRAAIEEAMTTTLPAYPDEVIIATVRADLDAIGAMVILALREEGAKQYGSSEWSYLLGTDLISRTAENRIRLVAESDKFSRGGWPGVRPLPTVEKPFDDSTASAESDSRLAPMAAAVADFKVPLVQRVEILKKWLLTGEEPTGYRERWIAERQALAKAISDGTIGAKVVADGRIAVVESTHRAATSVGYCLAPVVVALNPRFQIAGGEPHRKFTICTFEAVRWCNLLVVIAELAVLEAGWGGTPTIGGSPQGVSSRLTIDEVIAVVEQHLKFAAPRPCTCGQGDYGDGHVQSSYCG